MSDRRDRIRGAVQDYARRQGERMPFVEAPDSVPNKHYRNRSRAEADEILRALHHECGTSFGRVGWLRAGRTVEKLAVTKGTCAQVAESARLDFEDVVQHAYREAAAGVARWLEGRAARPPYTLGTGVEDAFDELLRRIA